MRNVFKGYQVSKLAVPQVHVAKINSSFANLHTPVYRKPALGLYQKRMPKMPKMPGKNPGT